MKEIVGNLVVTNLQKYLQKPIHPLSKADQAVADAVNELSKRIPYDFNHIRRSVVEAYEVSVASRDDYGEKTTLHSFEKQPSQRNRSESELPIINADALDHDKEKIKEEESLTDDEIIKDKKPLSTLEKKNRDDMEKTATWWHKYYASKAKLTLERRGAMDMNEGLKDSYDAYAEFFENENIHIIQKHSSLWKKLRQIFARADKAKKRLRTLANKQFEHLEESSRIKSEVDQSLDVIESDRLKELTLLQTFDVIQTELENVLDYEGLNDCLESFPLYKGKGSSRSDEAGDPQRIYTKFKGKIRIREVPSKMDFQARSSSDASSLPRLSLHPTVLDPSLQVMMKNKTNSGTTTFQQMFQLDFNQNPVVLVCRLYIVKAVLYRGWDRLGKADPFIKICLNNDTVIDGVKERILNTLEPVFGKSYEFEIKIPLQTLLRIQIWDWDLTSANDLIAETKIDVENRWLSCHRATCGLSKRYDSSGYNIWRDTKKPALLLNDMCLTSKIVEPVYAADFTSVVVAGVHFDCDPDVIDFVKNSTDISHRKARHESREEYIRQNTALAVLHEWGKKINPKHALVCEHIEFRSLFNPKYPETEQGKLEMWLDLFPISRLPATSMVDITPPIPNGYQLRLTVFNTSNVELNDENFLTGERTSDIYVKAWILGEAIDAQQTDIHYRSFTGEGNFNWRFVFDFQYLEIEEKIVFESKDSLFQVGNTKKKIPPRIIIRVYDADFLSADDFLGEAILNLTRFQIGAKTARNCKEDILLNPKHTKINLFTTKRIAGWWPLISPLKEGEIRDKALLGGKLEAEFSLITAEEATQNPIGKAREPPQPLEEPIRPKTSFLWFTSPLKTLRYIIWGNFKWTILLALGLFVLAFFILIAIWSIPSELVHQISSKIFGNKA